ncbi:hypothetical protein [Vibrio cincinnatiensis]|uniref:hypothetical protein n=1 Tax=Vibrio cincinnatiensis TaxID=675 RepID=UPI00130270EC|nr:hypothetical protein [Vibrio cincinnatiensis]
MNKVLYAYVNIEHPMVAWEVAIGRIKSICDGQDSNFGVSLWFYSLIQKYIQSPNSKRVVNEFKLEKIRQLHFPNQVSRLRGVYFFESREMANVALDRWGLSHHKKYVTEIYFSGNNYSYVDSEWITDYLDSEDEEWMHKYWRGETLGVKPLTEVLASGIGIIQDNELRTKAYEKIISQWPTTSILLNACIAGFAERKMEQIGQAIPAIVNESGILKGNYYINMNDFDSRENEIVEALREARSKGMNLAWIAPDDPTKIFSLCDWSHLNFELVNSDAVATFDRVHES